jgi:hypothetical protein
MLKEIDPNIRFCAYRIEQGFDDEEEEREVCKFELDHNQVLDKVEQFSQEAKVSKLCCYNINSINNIFRVSKLKLKLKRVDLTKPSTGGEIPYLFPTLTCVKY